METQTYQHLTDPLLASPRIQDTGDPILETFDIDMDEGLLILSFDETVNVSSLQIEQILLHGRSSVSYNLNTSFVDHAPLPTVTVQLSTLDINEPVSYTHLTLPTKA